MNKKQVKFLTYYLLQLLKSLNITIVLLIIIFNTTVLNYKYIQNKMDNNNYYELLYNDTLEKLEDIIIPTGLSSDIFEDTFTIKEVTRIEKKLIHNFYYREETKIESTSFKEKLKENIDKELKEKNLRVDNEEDITKLIDELTNEYENNLYYHNFLNNYKNTFYKFRNYTSIILVISILLLILVTILLEILHKKRDKMSIPLITNGIVFLTLFAYFKLNLNIDNLILYSKGLSIIITKTFNSILKIFIIVSIISILIGLLNRYVYFKKVLKHKKRKKKETYYEED